MGEGQSVQFFGKKLNKTPIAFFTIVAAVILAVAVSQNSSRIKPISITPSPSETPVATSTTTVVMESTQAPETTRKNVKGSNPKSIEFYSKVDVLRQQGKVSGELCTEYVSDPIVDVNPQMQSVQLSLMYPSIDKNVDDSDKALILGDFRAIKALAEQDPSLILPDYGTLRLFVLTFHDSSCIAKGELQQLMIDTKPEWIDWK